MKPFRSTFPPVAIASLVTAAAVVAILAASGGSAPTSGAARAAAPKTSAPICTRFASQQGSDGATGTKRRPFLTVQRLVNALRPGQVGCLLAGIYVQDVTVRRGGAAGEPVVVRSAPGVNATLRGRLWIAEGADWVTVTHIHLDGQNSNFLPSPTVDGDHDSFTYDDVTNDHMGGHSDGDGICFDIGDGSGEYGYAHYTLIEYDAIHDCGTSDNHNHGIYVNGSYYATIVRNWIWNNADRGIQLYPDAQHTVIEQNIIDGNGEGVIFSGDLTHASSNNLVAHNVIIDSTLRHNVEYWWPGPVGTNNVVTDNCVYGGAEGNFLEPQIGYTQSSNSVVQPQFTSPQQPAGIVPNTPCAADSPTAPPLKP